MHERTGHHATGLSSGQGPLSDEKTDKGWERISWDEALQTCAEKFNEVIEKYGPEAIIVGQGTSRDYESHFSRFGNLLGTPNMITAGHMCYLSRIGASLSTCGSLPACDYENNPKCIVMWACNPLWTNPDEYKGMKFWRAYEKGAKLICIDPRRSFYAQKAVVWLQIRPGTDAAMAMGFHRVIIEEELYDKEFCRAAYSRLGRLCGEGNEGLSPGPRGRDHLA